MKKGMEDNAQEPVSPNTAFAIGKADKNVFSQMEDREALHVDSPLLSELLNAFNLSKGTKGGASRTETEQTLSKFQNVSSSDFITERTGAIKTTRAQYRGSEPQNYIRLKKQHIICRNGGTKLTFETLAELAHAGARLIPSLGS